MAQITIQQTFDLALQLHQAGRLQEAERLYRQVLAQQPEHVDALHLLGVTAAQLGRGDVAVDLLRRAIALRPNFADAYSNLANALTSNGQLDQAVTACRQAIDLNPNLPEAHNNLGNALKDKGEIDQAIAAHRQAIALNPRLAEAHYNLGNALRDKGELGKAIAAYRQAIAVKPNYVDAHVNLGDALKEQGQLDEAIAAFRQAIVLRPGFAEVHSNLALALLTRGHFQEGWQEFEWRWKCEDSPALGNLAQPLWEGRPLEGRTILLHAEQGLGDAIQFIRYLPLVEQRGGRLVILCHTQLQRLFQANAGRWQVVTQAQPLPAFDLHCPLVSLPRVFGTNLGNIPKESPYLHADAEEARKWQDRLAKHSPLVKVGLVWAGRPAHTNDRNRSMKLARLAPLGQAPGVRFFSLQKGEAAAEAKTPPLGMELVDWTQELKDFADTAALIANLDLVIAVDTAVAHLAGAMGKPVWTLLPFVPDWRWMLQRQDSPWYPTMRLFRQPCRGDWDSVIARVVDALSLAKG
jgi:tetratricopeptide (TPR) repeat protein